jgi:hypothetical protein
MLTAWSSTTAWGTCCSGIGGRMRRLAEELDREVVVGLVGSVADTGFG